jgi:hypothetical protein
MNCQCENVSEPQVSQWMRDSKYAFQDSTVAEYALTWWI